MRHAPDIRRMSFFKGFMVGSGLKFHHSYWQAVVGGMDGSYSANPRFDIKEWPLVHYDVARYKASAE